MQMPRPLDNPLIFGNFYVAFASTQRTSQQNRPRELSLPLQLLLCFPVWPVYMYPASTPLITIT